MLTKAEIYVLRHLHGNAREAREVRLKLFAAGLQFCTQCQTVLALDAFVSTKTVTISGRSHVCQSCRLVAFRRRPIKLLDAYAHRVQRDGERERGAAQRATATSAERRASLPDRHD